MCNERRPLAAVYGVENERRRTARVCRGVDRSGALLKRWMGGGDGFAGMAGAGCRKL
jgi:hypothetical protein